MTGTRKFWQTRALQRNPLWSQSHWGEIRFGKVAVVVGVLFDSQDGGYALTRVKRTGLLVNGFAGFDGGDLALKLKVDRLLHVAKGVQVLDFDFGSELRAAHRANRNVDVAAQRALFHVAV